jgi:hypothetical protein
VGWLPAVVKAQPPEETNDLEGVYKRAGCENGLQQDPPWKAAVD